MILHSIAIFVVFWLCVGVVVYAYAVYPLAIWALARIAGRRITPPPLKEDDLPRVSLLIAAYNEEDSIAARIENALAAEYPREKFEIVIGSDGSDDRTASIVRSYADRGVRLLQYPHRRGKAAVLNDSLPQCRGEIVILSDANTNFSLDAPRRLVRWFGLPGVAAICGKLQITDPHTGRNVDSLYWRYETFLKRCEGRLGALLGANGAIYAIRKDQYVPIPRDTIVDDLVIPLLIKCEHGGRIYYEQDACAQEESPANLADEFGRRSRIGAGGFQTLMRLWRLLDPRHGWTAFCFLSHKVLRWTCPFLLIASLLSNLALLEFPLYRTLFTSQVAFYSLSFLGAFVPGRGLGSRLIRLTTMFTSMNVALMVGFWRWLLREQQAIWVRTARS